MERIMCDYSLMHVKSRPASVGDKLRTSNFGTGTRGFAAPEDPTTAVCVMPGTELAFDREIASTAPPIPPRTRRPSSGRSTERNRICITMR